MSIVTITATVTLDVQDIRLGEVHPNNCPVARALNRTLGGHWNVSEEFACDEGAGRSFDMPADAREFVNYFDAWALDGRQGLWEPDPFAFTAVINVCAND